MTVWVFHARSFHSFCEHSNFWYQIIPKVSVATYATCGGIFRNHFIADFLENLPLKFFNQLRFDRVTVEFGVCLFIGTRGVHGTDAVSGERSRHVYVGSAAAQRTTPNVRVINWTQRCIKTGDLSSHAIVHLASKCFYSSSSIRQGRLAALSDASLTKIYDDFGKCAYNFGSHGPRLCRGTTRSSVDHCCSVNIVYRLHVWCTRSVYNILPISHRNVAQAFFFSKVQYSKVSSLRCIMIMILLAR